MGRFPRDGSSPFGRTKKALLSGAFLMPTVKDNTSGTKLLSCTVKSTSKGVCSNPETASAAAAAGDRIEVQITSIGSNCNNKQWQVRFRY